MYHISVYLDEMFVDYPWILFVEHVKDLIRLKIYYSKKNLSLFYYLFGSYQLVVMNEGEFAQESLYDSLHHIQNNHAFKQNKS
jgi:hypothetical protein